MIILHAHIVKEYIQNAMILCAATIISTNKFNKLKLFIKIGYCVPDRLKEISATHMNVKPKAMISG